VEFFGAAEVFTWAARRGGQDFAVRTAAGPQSAVGILRSVDSGSDPGFRIAVGYRLENGLEVGSAYTYWNYAADAVERASGEERVFPTLTHPALVIEADSVRATTGIQMNLYDVEMGQRYGLSDSLQTRVFFGPRFASLNQSLTASHEGGEFPTMDTVRRRVRFGGGGLRVGGDADFSLYDHLGMYVRGSAGLLSGRFRSSLDESLQGVGVLSLQDRLNRTVPMADLGFGVTYQRGGIKFSVGYEIHNWFGIVEGLEFMEDTNPTKPQRKTGDLGFDGLFFRAELSF
jgi:hypothetical protein